MGAKSNERAARHSAERQALGAQATHRRERPVDRADHVGDSTGQLAGLSLS